MHRRAASSADQMSAGYTSSPRRRQLSFTKVDVVFKNTVLYPGFSARNICKTTKVSLKLNPLFPYFDKLLCYVIYA